MKKNVQKIKIYSTLARYYNLVYADKNYAEESKKIIDLIKRNQKSNGNKLLEAACGTGRFLEHLKANFACTGIDLSDAMLNVARTQVPEVQYFEADMTDFNFKKKFDVVLCLFSSIGYVKTQKNLEKAIANFARHLKPGGVLIIDPWLSKAQYKPGSLHSNIYRTDEMVIADLHSSLLKGNVAVLDIHYLIGEKGKRVKHFSETHEMGLFSPDKIIGILKENGFRVKFYKKGLRKNRHLYMGVKE